MKKKGASDSSIRKAMYELKAVGLCCSIIPFLFAFVLCYLYWGLLDVAKDFNERTPADWNSHITFFDACGGITDG